MRHPECSIWELLALAPSSSSSLISLKAFFMAQVDLSSEDNSLRSIPCVRRIARRMVFILELSMINKSHCVRRGLFSKSRTQKSSPRKRAIFRKTGWEEHLLIIFVIFMVITNSILAAGVVDGLVVGVAEPHIVRLDQHFPEGVQLLLLLLSENFVREARQGGGRKQDQWARAWGDKVNDRGPRPR